MATAHRPTVCAALFLLTAASFTFAVDIPAEPKNAAAPSLAEVLDHLKPGEWYEVPNSRLDAVAASQSKFPWLSGGIGGITACWAGGAFDSQRDRLYIGPGGGHAGYNGNEVYAFDVSSLKWIRLNDPDPVIPGTEYTDLNKAPFAMHTYDGVEYLPPPADRYLVVGGWGTPRTYEMDPDHPEKWEVYADHGTGRTGDISACDPVTGHLWLSTPSTAGKLSEWDPQTHRWTLRMSSTEEPSYYETADVDSKHRLLVSCGKGKLKVWGIEPAPKNITFHFAQTTGGEEIVSSNSPGFCYVPLIDKFVGWAKGADVYTLDLDAQQWTKHAPAATNTVTPGPPDQWGTFGRFRYVASKNIFIVYNAVNQNVFLYRLTADKPNVITAVEAKAIKPKVDAYLPTAAISVQAIYADGSRKDVTQQASYFSEDPNVAAADIDGKGIVRGTAGGEARIRAVYSDPAFGRGYASTVKLLVNDILPQATLDAINCVYPKLTIVAGDSFTLQAAGSYARGVDHFDRDCTSEATWTSDAPDIATVTGGVIKAGHKGGPATITASLKGKTYTTAVTVTDAPVIQRIRFQVKETFDRPGWDCDNGQAFTDSRGFGWLDTKDFATRDDRNSAKTIFLRGFVLAKMKPFKVKVPPGPYVVRIGMGDSDYGAVPFDFWTAVGNEKLIYYEGQKNDIATKVVNAGEDGITFTVNGHLNYLVIAPVGTDLNKYADDDTGEKKP